MSAPAYPVPMTYCKCGLPADPKVHRTYDGRGTCCATPLFQAMVTVGRRYEEIERLWRMA